MLHANARVLRLALFTSLGLVPLGCAGRSADAAARTDDLTRDEPPYRSTGDPPADELPVDVGAPEQDDGRTVDPARPPLASCGADAPVLVEELPVGISGRAVTLEGAMPSGLYRCDNGVLHRPASVTCASSLPRPSPPFADAGADAAAAQGQPSQVEYLYGIANDVTAPGACSSDAECTARPFGFCAPTFYGGPALPSVQCHYGCSTDDDCSAGQLCECGDPIGRCVDATCRTDDDCPGDLMCAAWFTANVCGTGQRFSCQTRQDECNTAADCAGGNGSPYCSGEGGVRTCKVDGSVCGRPFLVQGEARLAACIDRADWAHVARDEPAGDLAISLLSERELRFVGERWAMMGSMEHASIAAFARFTLQLLELGAPSDLVELSQRAMLDETQHTRLCFDLASRYLGRAVGPGRLPTADALQETELVSIVVTAFREGCVGETVATLEARAAGACAAEPEIQRALARIAEDELRHAELAYRFVSWAIAEHGASVRSAIAAELRQLELELVGPRTAPASAAAAAAHGILSERNKLQVRRIALDEVVLPCARALLGSPGAAALSASIPAA